MNNTKIPRSGLAIGKRWWVVVAAGILLASCGRTDDVPPVITMNGADTIYHVLNEVYNDPGVSAIDETDGNISDKVFIDNQVDIDRMGEYSVSYRVVDEAGNEAPSVSRVVFVYNQGLEYYGDYFATEYQVFPDPVNCSYPTYLWVDSTLNCRLLFIDFACNSNRQVYADVYDTLIIIPFQLIQDSTVDMSLQGSGFITDTLIHFEYTRTEAAVTSYWKSNFTRLK